MNQPMSPPPSTDVGAARAVTRIHQPDRAALDACINAHQPVILTGLMAEAIATRRWDLPYLRTQLGPQKVVVVKHDKPRLYWDPAAGLPFVPTTFDAYADSLERPAAGEWSYLQDDTNSFPHLREDHRLPAMLEEKGIVRGKLWISGAGLITPLHYDAVETFHWVIRGSKRFLCYAPGVRNYYPFPWHTTAPFISQADPDAPDPQRFPRLPAPAFDFTVEPGEVLYLPAFWWHQVYSQGAFNVSVNYVFWASAGKYAGHLPQLTRSARHLLVQYRKARAKARAAARAADVAGRPAAHAGPS